MRDHDVKPGPLHHCQVCGSHDLRLLIDLGHQPPCDSLLSQHDLTQPEMTYPLRLNQCEICSLAQLDYVVEPSKVYPNSYPYRAGISWPVVAAHKQMASSLVDRFGTGLCVDIGCNDGTLLAQFARLGCGVMGIEPTDIARYARESGIPTVQGFFTQAIAWNISSNHGKAHIITMTNVFAHMADLGEVMRGVCEMLADDGVLVIENHYLLDILERNQFDSIYHEHVRTYTLKSLMLLFSQYDLEVFDVQRVPRYGGNIRVFIGRNGRHAIATSVRELLRKEEAAGLSDAETWQRFLVRVLDGRDAFMEFAYHSELAGCSAPGRASTLLNWYGVNDHLMPWTGELDGSLKIGKYIPGCHIPVVHNRRIAEEQPEYLVLLAWHYADEIEARLRREGVKSTLVLPLPELSFRPASIGIAA